jgi:hypothetical protein
MRPEPRKATAERDNDRQRLGSLAVVSVAMEHLAAFPRQRFRHVRANYHAT